MKKGFAFALTVLIVAVAVPALADVTVTATIDKVKDKFIEETLDKFKLVLITVITPELELEGAAEVEAIVNVTNTENDVAGGDFGTGNVKVATLTDSVLTNSGILGVNQDVGNMVNQANVVSVGISDSPTAFVEAQAGVDQENTLNSVFSNESEFFADVGTPDRSASITGSINTNAGIVGVNQNAGNMNNQTNAVALAVGLNAVVALAEADLGQVNSDNVTEEIATNKLDLISGSISGNTGIVSVNQSSGNMNNQAAVVSIAAITSTVVVNPTVPVRAP